MPRTKREKHFWAIAPYHAEVPKAWVSVWKFDLDNEIISIGWEKVGPVKGLSKEEIGRRVKTAYRKWNATKVGRVREMLWKFYHEVQAGDIVVARRGRNEIAAIGTVEKAAYYEYAKNRATHALDNPYPHHIGVAWCEELRNINLGKNVFGIHTIHSLKKDGYHKLFQGAFEQEKSEITGEERYCEGEERASKQTVRNPKLRAAAKRYWGLKCYCCGFDFEAFYGSCGEGLGIVHHLEPFGKNNGKSRKTGVKDTRVVCANCHLVLHAEDPPIDAEDLRKQLQQRWVEWSEDGIERR